MIVFFLTPKQYAEKKGKGRNRKKELIFEPQHVISNNVAY